MTDKITDKLYFLEAAFEGKEIGYDLFRKIIDLKQAETVLEAIETIEILYGELKKLNDVAYLILKNHQYRIGNDYGELIQRVNATNLVLKKYKKKDES